MKRLLPLLGLLIASPALAGSVTQQVQTTVKAKPLTVSPSQVTADCSWATGTVVLGMTASGGDGNAITWSMTQPGTDFTINASTGVITIGAGGIATANCGTTENISVTATQP